MSFQSQTLTFRRDHVTQAFDTSDLIAVSFAPGVQESEIGIEEIVSEVVEEVVRLDREVATRLDRCLDPEHLPGLGSVPVRDAVEVTTQLFRLQAPERSPELLNRLLENDDVDWAGPLVAQHEGTLAYLTHEMVVTIRPPADAAQVLEEAEELGYAALRVIPYAPPGTYHLRAAEHPGYALLDHAEQLMRTPGVLAEPNLAGTAEPDSVPLAGALPENLWDRELIGVPAAWRALEAAGRRADDPGVVLMVVDGSFDGPDANLRDYRPLDFRRLLSGRDVPGDPFGGRARGHGIRAAGVAAAAGVGGVWGAAPGCRVLAAVYPVTELDVLDMYLWAAGIDPKSPRRGFPKMLSEPAAIVTTSVGFGFAKRIPISRTARHAFDRIARDGRGGKGTLLFFSAGNGAGYVDEERPWAAAEPNFGIAASTLGASNRPMLAPYSNHHGVKLCAPASAGTRTAAGTTSRGIVSIGTTDFGGTSSATPLAAGAAALVLAARPDLTHSQVREILRGSAERIDPDAEKPLTVWRDERKLPAPRGSGKQIYSNAYGFGQIHAARAVQAALDFKQPAGSLLDVRKNDSPASPSFIGSSGFQLASLILGIYHFLFAALVLLWPYAERRRHRRRRGGATRGLAAVSAVLGAYHLIVWDLLRGRRRSAGDDADEDAQLSDPGPRGGSG